MQNNITRNNISHCIISIMIIILLYGWFYWNQYKVGPEMASINTFMQTLKEMKLYFVYEFISLVFFLVSIYFTYKYSFKTKIYKIIQIFLYPFLGAFLFPVAWFITCFYLTDNSDLKWHSFYIMLVGMTNTILYLMNEILLWYNLRKMSQK